MNVTDKGGAVKTSISVAESGTTLTINGPPSLGLTQLSTYVVKLTDSSAKGIANAQISLTSSAGNTITPHTAGETQRYVPVHF